MITNAKPISKEQAKAAGLTRFYTGLPCNKGHICERQTKNSNCVTCNKIRINQYIKSDKGKIKYKARQKRWRATTPYFKLRKKTIEGKLAKRHYILKRRATEKGIEFTLTLPEYRNLVEQQQGKCVLTGRVMTPDTKNNLNLPSLDRKNHKKGYHLGNVRLITWQANSARSIGTDLELLNFCRDVIKFAKKRGARWGAP